MQICSKLFVSKVSKPKISNTPIDAELFCDWGWYEEMLSLTLATMKSNAAPYVAFISASHAFLLWITSMGVWTISFPARMARVVSASARSWKFTPRSLAAAKADGVWSKWHPSACPREFLCSVEVKVILPQWRIAATRRINECIVSGLKPIVS